jgi:predicted secreted protein with PEFG-CTERM motif
MIVEGQQILIRINKPDGNPCRIDPIDLPATGSYTYQLVLGGICGVTGEYEVEVTYGDEQASTSFGLIGGSSELEYNLNVEGSTYPIKYELTGGSISNMFARPAEDRLVIIVDADQAGQLTVELPRQVIDAIENGEDIDYIVTVEDASGNIDTVEIEESENTDTARTLVIDYPAGGGRIEIAGTRVVPEFGSIAMIIMAVAIVGILLASGRFSNISKFTIFRQ